MDRSIGCKKAIGNSMWQIAERVISLIFSIIITSIIARYLGVEQYGMLNYIMSIMMLFSSFSRLGMENLTVKAILEKEETEGKILGTNLFICLIVGIILFILSQITIYTLNPDNMLAQVLGFIIGLGMIVNAFDVIEYYLQSQMKIKTISIIKLFAEIISVGLKIITVIFDFGIIGFTLANLCEIVIVSILFWLWYKYNRKTSFSFSFKYGIKVLKRCWELAISGLIITLYMKMDQIMLGYMLNNTEIGIYSAANKVANIWQFIPMAIITAFGPMLVLKKQYSKLQYEIAIQRLYDIISIIGISFGIFLSLFGNLILDVLYGEEYKNAIEVLQISIWSGIFSSLGAATSLWLIIENLQKYSLIYAIAGCITNFSLNIWLIPLMGAKGAAIATLISGVVTNILIFLLFKKTRTSSIKIIKAIFSNKTIKEVFEKVINIICYKNRGLNN